MFWRSLIVFSLILVNLCTLAFAERKEEWKEQNFDFSKVRTIAVTYTVAPKLQLDLFATKNIENAIHDTFIKDDSEIRWVKRGIHFTTDTNSLIKDATLQIKVINYGYDKYWVEETKTTETIQEEKTVEEEYKDSNGKWIKVKKVIKVPVEKTEIVPAHWEYYTKCGAEAALVHAETGKTIWMILDDRQATSSKEPKSILGRIITRFGERLEGVLK